MNYTLSHKNLDHTMTFYLCKIHFKSILPYFPVAKSFPPLGNSNKNFIEFGSFPHVLHIPVPPQTSYPRPPVMRCSVDRQFLTEVSGRSICLIVKGKEVQGCQTLENGLTVCTETSVTTNLYCVTSTKSEGFIYTVAEA